MRTVQTLSVKEKYLAGGMLAVAGTTVCLRLFMIYDLS